MKIFRSSISSFPQRTSLILQFVTFLLFLYSSMAIGQQTTINVDQMLQETQIGSTDPDEMEIIWWIPVEFWIGNLQLDDGMSETDKQDMIDVLRPYVIFAVVDGKIGPWGGITYTPLTDLSGNVKLIDDKGKKHDPVAIENLNSDMKILLSTLKPILQNMLGDLADNMHFFVFEDQSSNGERLADPAKDQRVRLEIPDATYEWTTPLGSVLPLKTCPKDDKKLNGAWDYCPWHGDKLVFQQE